MLVKFFLQGQYAEVETSFTSLKSIFNYLSWHYPELAACSKQACKYIMLDSTEKLPSVALHPSLIGQDLGKYDTLVVTDEVAGSGELVAAGLGFTVGTFAYTAVAVVVNIAITIGLNFAMQALAPSPEFNSDPAATQTDNLTSNLFNGIPLIREQGGITPLVFGNPFCGGVLISAAIVTSG